MAHIEYHNNVVALNQQFNESHKDLIQRMGTFLKLKPEKIDECVQLFLGEKLKLKPMKDPNKPKGAKTAYIFYQNEKRAELKKKHNNWDIGKIAKEIGTMWRKLNTTKRQPSIQMAKEDKERATEQLEKYKASLY